MRWIKEHPHMSAMLIIAVIGLIAYSPWITTMCMNYGDVGNEYIPFFFYHQKAMFESGEVPLWIHQISSGTPFFAVGDKPILYPFTILSLALLDYGTAFNANVIFHLLLAGVGMYLLAFYLIRKPHYALISALVFMLNFHVFRKMQKFWGVSWIPWVLLCIYLALDAKDHRQRIAYSILAALPLAAIFHVGSVEIALYSVVMIVILSVVRLLSSPSVDTIKSIALVGIISGLFFAGFIAIKLLPNAEFGALTSRAQGISLEQAKGSYFIWDDIAVWDIKDGLVYAPKSLVLNLFKGAQKGASTALGLIPTIFLFASLALWRKKTVLAYWVLIIFAILMVTASFLFEFFYNYVPGFDKLQHAERLGIIFVTAAAVLAGFGAQSISTWAQKKWPSVHKHKNMLFVALIILLIIDMVYVLGFAPVLATYPFGECKEYQKTPIMQYLADLYDPKDPFRIKTLESPGRGITAQYVTIPLGLDTIEGQYGGLWIPQYINEYLSLANNYPSKFWGNLNGRFLTTTSQVNMSGFVFVKEFTPCPDCIQPMAAGPYLYENQNYLPRAFWVKDAMLVVGQNEQARQVAYSLLSNDVFDLSHHVMINGVHDKIQDYSLEELSQFKVLILTPNSVDPQSMFVLEKYKKQGGILLPDILANQESVTAEDLKKVLDLFNQSIKPLKIESTINTLTLDMQGLAQGWMVVNERMHLFPGWSVELDGKEILDGERQRLDKVNVMLSGFHLNAPAQQAMFEYSPRSYEIGKKLTLLTILVSLGYTFWFLWQRRKHRQSA
ncbi:MAG TPA: hypothetical protein VJH22_07125 [Candidatus Nanoarchaeia archaeon]|nr:hypothetical protein [Candidatus Nanoarchaeia archaeon]